MTYTYKGKRYSSIAKIASDYGMSPDTLRNRIKKGYSLEKAIEVRKNKTRVVSYKGLEYDSVYKLASVFNMRPEYIYGRIRKGMSIDDTMEEIIKLQELNLLRRDFRKQDKKVDKGKIRVWSKEFNSIDEVEEMYGLGKGTITSDGKIEEVIIKYMEPEVKSNYKRYKTISRLARHYGMQPDNVHQRIKKGWNLTESVIVPVRERQGSKIKYEGNYYLSRAELASAHSMDGQYIYALSRELSMSWMETFQSVRRFVATNKLDEIRKFPGINGSQSAIVYDSTWFDSSRDLLIANKEIPRAFLRKKASERLSYLKSILGEPSGVSFNYREELIKFISGGN